MANNGKDKYYAVASGRQPGVYKDWQDAKAQTDHYSNNLHKSFNNAQDAHKYANDPFYAVKEGRAPGIYRDWDSAKGQVHGYSNNQHQKFDNYQDAKQFIKK